METIELKAPVRPKRCQDGRHFEHLLIWGKCPKCKREWGLGENENAFERAMAIKAAGI